MYLLPCQHCEKTVKVSPSQAGDEIPCSHCDKSVAIPKLGELRQLPTDDGSGDDARRNSTASDASVGGRIGFVFFALVAVLALMIGLFCGIRWVSSPATETTESVITKIEQDFAEMEPASLINEFDDMENRALDFPLPYNYHTEMMEKLGWRNKTLLSGGVALLAGIVAIAMGSKGSGREE